MPEQLTNQIQKTNIDSQPIKKSYSFNTTNSSNFLFIYKIIFN